jgi:DNA-binding XRE family transcriptional regulator
MFVHPVDLPCLLAEHYQERTSSTLAGGKETQEVGKLLKKLRKERFKTQSECAHALGLTGPSMIGALESGTWYNQAVVSKLINYLKGV